MSKLLNSNYVAKGLILSFFISLPLQCFFGENISNYIMILSFFYLLILLLLKKKIKVNLYIILFALFFLYACSSIFYSHELRGTGYVLRKLIPIFLFGVSMSIYIKSYYSEIDKIQFIESIFNVYMIVVFCICIYLIIFEMPTIGIMEKLGAKLFVNIGLTIWTYHLCFAIDFCLYFLIKSYLNERKIKKQYIFILIILVGCSYLSSVRKVILSPILFFVVFFIIKNKESAFKVFKYIVAFFAIFAVLYYILTTNERLYLVIGRRLESLIFSILGINNISSFVDYSVFEREMLRTNAINLFFQYPIFGYGLDAFKFYTGRLGTSEVYSHVNYLELLACTGIVGFSLYYSSFIYLIQKLLRKIKSNIIFILLTSILISQLVLDFGSVTYYSSIYISFYFLFCSLI